MRYIKNFNLIKENRRKASRDNSSYTVYNDNRMWYFFDLNSAVRYATELTKEPLLEKVVTIFKSSCYNMTDYDSLMYWWGNNICIWYNTATDITPKPWLKKDAPLCNPTVFEKYLFGLDAVANELIPSMPNAFQYLEYIRDKFPDMWKKLYALNPNLDSAADMGSMGF